MVPYIRSIVTMVLPLCVPPQAAKISRTSVPDAVLTAPRSQTQISFQEWSVETNEEDSASNYVFAVTSLGDVAPQGGLEPAEVDGNLQA